ncbi:hypothetical protein CE91St64_23190 [Faecalicatena contorta]|nr:hypothetical protein CE91St64_23190 [Faecalicatena contorta]
MGGKRDEKKDNEYIYVYMRNGDFSSLSAGKPEKEYRDKKYTGK